jgi:hypothetical protein
MSDEIKLKKLNKSEARAWRLGFKEAVKAMQQLNSRLREAETRQLDAWCRSTWAPPTFFPEEE